MMIYGNPVSVNLALENVTSLEAWRKIDVPVRVFCLLFSIWGIIGNGTLICLLSCKIPKTRFTVYILNITIADFFLLFNYFVNTIFFQATAAVPFMSLLQYLAYLFGNDVSIYFLTVIIVGRYIVTYFPAWYERHRPATLTIYVCVILWTLSLIMVLLEYFSCHPKYHYSAYYRCRYIVSLHFIFNSVLFVSLILFSTLTFFIRIHTQRILPKGIDISIWASVVRLLIFGVPIKIVEFLYLWESNTFVPALLAVAIIFDTICSSACPYIYLFIGWWTSPKLQRSIHILIEEAFSVNGENTVTTTQEDQEQV